MSLAGMRGRSERRCGEEIRVAMMLQAGERDGMRAPAEPTAVGARAERHEAARRGLRRIPTGVGGRAAGGAARGVRRRETGAGSGVGVTGVGGTGSNTGGSGGGWSRTHRATSETVDVSRRPVGVRYWRQGCHPGERRGPGVRFPPRKPWPFSGTRYARCVCLVRRMLPPHPFNPNPNPPPICERTPQDGDGGGGRERPRVSLGPTRSLNHRPLRRGLVAPCKG